MQINLADFSLSNKCVAVAVSGGSDSMALLHYMHSQAQIFNFSVIALNIEHGIRGEQSISDTNFVISYCKEKDIPLLAYSADCIEYAKKNKLSLEQAGRIVRYSFFNQALNEKKCDLIATAHHLKDNFESILFNLFRGTGYKGLRGIEENFENKIIRPFLSISKEEIRDYILEHSIPYVTDQTNFCDEYTRNAIRLNIIPQIEKVFPNAEKCAYRFSQIAKLENDFLEEQALKATAFFSDRIEISLPLHEALLGRATVLGLKHLGVEKDWTKTHIDSISNLAKGANGKEANLKNGIIAIKEYDKIVFIKELSKNNDFIKFELGEHQLNGQKLLIKEAKPMNLKSGFYCDKDKIPNDSVIRTRQDGDKFLKFGGGTKNLSDYLTDKKIPPSKRDSLLVLASGNDVLAIFGLAISEKIKVDNSTKNILQLAKEEK